MTQETFVLNNERKCKMYELYLNRKGTDVNFVFDADTHHPKKVPAHRIILSLHSPVFDTMFFGSIPEQANVPIVDAPAAAFNEFLQFFYLDEVRLTSANIVHVTNLCKKYEMIESLKLCETVFQESLTSNDMCWGYSLALLLEQEKLSQFCEEEIKWNAGKIIKSDGFLERNGEFLSKILTLVSSDWSAMEICIACLEWSKAQCKRHNLDISPTNLRDQLGDTFSRIPFNRITTKQICDHIISYYGFFTVKRLEMFYRTWFENQPNPFNLQQLGYDPPNILSGRRLKCNRKLADFIYSQIKHSHIKTFSTTIFSSNTSLLLIGFNMFHSGYGFKYKVYEGTEPSELSTRKLISRGHSSSQKIVFLQNVPIFARKFYRIRVSYRQIYDTKGKINRLSNRVHLNYGIRITFVPDDSHTTNAKDTISKLLFETPDELPFLRFFKTYHFLEHRLPFLRRFFITIYKYLLTEKQSRQNVRDFLQYKMIDIAINFLD